jgi:HAD superfamily hydrolase (TIGR01509 family)
MKKLIIFDCDGTLVDSEIIAAKVFPAVWATMGVTMTEDYFICNFVGTGSDAEIVKTTMAKLPPDAMEIGEKKFDEELSSNLKAVTGMIELLSEIPHAICVASNSSHKYVVKALETTELKNFFGEKVYSSRDLAKPKPAPDVFLHAASTLGFLPEQCLVIEDSISGILAGKNAGMKVVGFMGGLHFNSVVKDRLLTAQADYYCSSVEDLRELILNF